MTLDLWALAALAYMLVGVVVWSLIDDDQLSILKWYERAPWAILQGIFLCLWPAGIAYCLYQKFWKKQGEDHASEEPQE